MTRPRTGIVLSGGGARGMAHAGVLRALGELGVQIDHVSATSAGAIIGALFCDGMNPLNMPAILKGSRLFELRGISFDFRGFMKPGLFRNLLRNHLKATTFEELSIPLVVNATNFNLASSVYFNSGDLVEPIVASCSIPLVFTPVKMNGHDFVDGGLLNNLPVEPLLGKCDRIIGVHVNPIGVKEKKIPMRRVLERCFHIAIANTIHPKLASCDVFIEPAGLAKFSVFDTDHAVEIARIGYEATMQMADKIKAVF